MSRLGGLDHDRSGIFAPTGAARHLHQQLERTLRRAEIGIVEQIVGVEHTDQLHAAEIESFGNHLRPHQNIVVAPGEGLDDLPESTLGGNAVAVEPGDPRLGENAGDLLLDLFRPEAHRHGFGHPAMGALGRNRLRMTAIVTDHTTASLVERESHITIRTAGRPAALPALDIGCETPPVLEKHRLTASAEGLLHTVEQQFVEMGMPLAAFHGTDRIGHEDLRHPRRSVTLG